MTDSYKETVFEKTFTNHSDAISDERFEQFLFEVIKSVEERVLPPKNMRFKRSERDYMIENNLFPKVMDEFELIIQKKSERPSVIRNYILLLVKLAINKTVMSYSKVVEKK